MKAVLISIRPQWCELIASGQKTIEVRKTRPKLKAPFKCYIYCTKAKPHWYDFGRKTTLDGKVIGEFVCDKIVFGARTGTSWRDARYYFPEKVRAAMFLSQEEIETYGSGAYLYGWHISDLMIYDRPRELSEFHREETVGDWTRFVPLTRPPQSWRYVEEVQDGRTD